MTKNYSGLGKSSRQNISDHIKKTMKTMIENDTPKAEMTLFFGELYDSMYHDLVFRKIEIEKKVRRLRERLAYPDLTKTEKERQDIISRIKLL